MKVIRESRPCLVERWVRVSVSELWPGDVALVGAPAREVEVLAVQGTGGEWVLEHGMSKRQVWWEVEWAEPLASKGNYPAATTFTVRRVMESDQ